mgnify:CR=1 FL=1
MSTKTERLLNLFLKSKATEFIKKDSIRKYGYKRNACANH